MERRKFLASSLAAATYAGARSSDGFGGQAAVDENGREYYELRRYHLRSGPQVKLTHDYLRQALLPALNRLGVSPVGVFNTVLGPESPTLHLLLPSPLLETLADLRFRLQQDAAYLQAGSAFLSAPASSPAYIRVESELMIAFQGRPRLTVPPVTAARGARVFELRTYESPTDRDHERKVEMFHSGEFDVFEKAGFWQVFYGDKLVGPRLPNLTYMLGFPNLAARDNMWAAFGSAPDWKKLTSSPRFNFEETVCNITNIILSPTPYSQI